MRPCYLEDNPAHASLPPELCCFRVSLYFFVLNLKRTFSKHQHADSPLATQVSGYWIKIVLSTLCTRNNKLLVSWLWLNSGDSTGCGVTTGIAYIQRTFLSYFILFCLIICIYFMAVILFILFIHFCTTLILISIKKIDTGNPTHNRRICVKMDSWFWCSG